MNMIVSVAVVGAVVAVAYFGRVRPEGVPVDALAVVPADATAILRIDVARLRSSKLWRRLVHERGADQGLEELTRTCGFDPLATAHDLVVFVRGDGEEPLAHVGFVLRGQFDAERLSRCVGSALTRDGAELRRTQVAGLPAIAGGRGDSRFAFVGHEAVLGGSEQTVTAIADVLAGRAPNATTGELAASYREVSEGADVSLAARTPGRWLAPLRRAAAEASPGLERAITLAPLLSAGARLRDGVALDLRVGLADAAGASTADAAARQALTRLDATPGLSLLGLGALPRQIHIHAQGSELRLSAAFEGALLDRILDLVGQSMGGANPRPPGDDVEYAPQHGGRGQPTP